MTHSNEDGSFVARARPSVHESCDEGVFRRFMMLERKRSSRSGKPCLLLLVPKDDDWAEAGDDLLKLLSLNLRSSDIVGWFRQDRVAGAVLTQTSSSADWRLARSVVSKRLAAAMRRSSGRSSRQRSLRIRRMPSPERTTG